MKPAVVGVSVGTAAVLGLAQVPMDTAPTTAYLMLGGRCLMDCAFCAQARGSRTGTLNLSRVTWPEYPLGGVIEHLAEAVARGDLRRACLQVTVTPEAFEQALAVVHAVRSACDVPVDVAILPHTLDQVRLLLEAGVDHIGFGLDAACERVFRVTKGGDWSHRLDLIEETALEYPRRAAVHLILGLGETEAEMAERIQWGHDLGLIVGLFAFTPVRGTRLEDRAPPPLDAYRRMQAARWLVTHNLARCEQMAFDGQQRLARLGAPLPGSGEPFETSGCPDCNRPYYNERPGGVTYNYPRPLSAEEAAEAMADMGPAPIGRRP